MKQKNGSLCLLLALAATMLLSGCGVTIGNPKIAVLLPEEHNTPDGMALGKDGNIYLSAPNFGDPTHQAAIMYIDKDDKLHQFIKLPPHPETKKACPLGIAFGSDGNLYIADAQALGGKEGQFSRLLKVTVTGGKAVKCEVVIDGFFFSNAVACNGKAVYVTETSLGIKNDKVHYSGVYRFDLSELDGAKPIKLADGGKDKHLIARLETYNKAWPVGANGLDFDPEGNMYVCNFGEASIVKFKMNATGTKPVSSSVLVKGKGILCTDGMDFAADGMIYVADFLGNAVHQVCPKTGTVTTLAKNSDTDGAGGRMDRPSEARVRGKRVYVSNIDLEFPGVKNTYDAPHTISVIDLEECCGKCKKDK